MRAIPERRRPRLGLRVPWLAGLVLLALSWLTGGWLVLLPAWAIALVLLAVPALLAAREQPVPVAVLGALLLVGLVPWVPAVETTWSDAIPADGDGTRREDTRVKLLDLGSRGPRMSGFPDGFGGWSVTTTPAWLLVGGVWMAAWAVAGAGTGEDRFNKMLRPARR